MELDPDKGDPDDGRYSFATVAVTAAVALLVGVTLCAAALFVLNVVNTGWNRSTASSAAPATRSAAASAAPATTPSTRPAIAPPCRDNAAQFVHTVRTRVDPDGDELLGFSDAALVQLGHAALKQPSVLASTRLVSFQRPRFIEAANRWLCH